MNATQPTVPRRDTRDHFRGCLLGGAIGDALGAPVEFMRLGELRARFGPGGVEGLEPAYGRRGAITDDTQLTLFTAEGLLRARNRARARGMVSVEHVVLGAYGRWLETQRPGRAAPTSRAEREAAGWLAGVAGLQAVRAPGTTCLEALERAARGGGIEARNDSKGCGGVMRIAPVGLVDVRPFDLGCRLAALTHGHPTGQLAAGALAELIGRLVAGAGLRAATHGALATLERREGHQETSRALRRALALADAGRPSAERVESLGAGWVAEEALAIGLYAALVAEDFAHGVRLAVNHSGDSDSTGSIAGQLLGLLCGEAGLPLAWREQVELAEVVTAVADDLWAHFVRGAGDPEPLDWARYPGV